MGQLPGNIYFGVAAGFLAALVAASALNVFGDAMYERGYAKPFYLGGRRVHHRAFLFAVLPGAYLLLTSMVIEGMVRVVWSMFWTGVASTLIIGLGCLVFDIGFDYVRAEGEGWFLKQEMIYLAIPLFVFTNFIRMAL